MDRRAEWQGSWNEATRVVATRLGIPQPKAGKMVAAWMRRFPGWGGRGKGAAEAAVLAQAVAGILEAHARGEATRWAEKIADPAKPVSGADRAKGVLGRYVKPAPASGRARSITPSVEAIPRPGRAR